MNSLDEFNLSWDKFETNLKQSYAGLREAPDFSDVTLVCADGDEIEAHKVILATASPFFFNMLHSDKHPHPRIYMTGMKLTKLTYIVDFIYHGEVSVAQQDISQFLELAEELKLKGLSKTAHATPHEKEDLHQETKESCQNGADGSVFPAFIGTSDQDMEIQSHQKSYEELVNHMCPYCSYSCNSKPTLRTHVWRNHRKVKKHEEQIDVNDLKQDKSGAELIKLEPGLSHDNTEATPSRLICNICQNSFNTQSAMRMHICKKHKQDKTLEDDKTDKQTLGSDVSMEAAIDTFGTTDDMMLLKDGIWRCVVCNKQATRRKGDLTAHVETHMEGLAYKCKFCPVISKSKGARNTHVYRKHSAAVKI